MNFQFYVEKLFDSDEFRKFANSKKDAVMCGGFLALDRDDPKNSKNEVHIDYFVPSEKKIYSFKMNDGVSLVPQENFDGRVPEKVKDNVDFAFDEIEQMVNDKLIEKEIKNSVKKFVLSLQSVNKNMFLIGTIFLSNMALAKVQIDLEKMNVDELEKKSFFDMLKKG